MAFQNADLSPCADLLRLRSRVIRASHTGHFRLELAWARGCSRHELRLRERHGEAIYRFEGPALAKAGDGMLPSDLFHRIVVLSFQEDAMASACLTLIGGRHTCGAPIRRASGRFPDFERSSQEILAGVPADEQAKPAPDRDPGDRRRQPRLRHRPSPAWSLPSKIAGRPFSELATSFSAI